MTENKTEKKKGIDLVVRSAIERVLAADQAEGAASVAAEKPAAAAQQPRAGQRKKAPAPGNQAEQPSSPQAEGQKKKPSPKKKATAAPEAAAPVQESPAPQSRPSTRRKKAPIAPAVEAPAAEAAPAEKPAAKAPQKKKKPSAASPAQAEQPAKKNNSGTKKGKSSPAATSQPTKAAEKTGSSKAPKAGSAQAKGKSNAKAKPVNQPSRSQEADDSPLAIFSSNKLASNNQKRQAISVITERRKTPRDHKIRIIPLGGLGEVGKNMTMIEYDENILVVDGGVTFPGDGMFGIDLVLPDYSYLIEKKDQVRAFLLTHGHEDHIGAMPYILKDVNAPVYGSALTLGLLRGKLNEQQVRGDLRRVEARQELEIGPFKVEFIRLTHSIPDSMGLAIHTPIGCILFISDFKMDMTPIDGNLMDYGRISALGEKGVLLLLSDSTNVEKEGFSQSERSVGHNLERYFAAAPGRIIVTSFASHVHRAQQVIWAAARTGRKVAVVGRGMQNMFNVAGSLGYLQIPDRQLIDVEDIDNYPASQVVVMTTGSQGEPLSGLTRMSSGEHRQVRIMAGDTVIISATPIPGNERTVGKTVDNLFRLGANVIHERSQGIHVSGHASKEELKMLINMVHPKFFMPIHGEYRMLYKHAQLAQSLGMPAENTVIMENGQILELSRRQCRISGTVPSGKVYIDGLGVGDVGASILKERRQLSESGVIVISLIYTVKKNTARILSGPEIYTQGFIFEKNYEHIIGEMKEKVLALCSPETLADGSLNDLRNQVRSKMSKFVQERTGRKPVIMAVISQV
ncbi:MAG: RNase J family beta-CASP ribonuclease [Firmicutes bacterium]|nr:RNase J family beta-CASP ribonuclease [Bacillota bacterium]